MSTFEIKLVGTKHELCMEQAISKTYGLGSTKQTFPPEIFQQRIELEPCSKLEDTALAIMKLCPEKQYQSFSLHKIETYQDEKGKTYYSDTVIEELNGPTLLVLKSNIK